MAIETLRVIWWALTGIVLMGFAVADGYDFGSAMLTPLVTRSDADRRVVLNSIGPFWEGNQVWFVVGGGAVFAAWPLLYATAFSVLYLALFLVLLMLILRPVAIVYRSKRADPAWRATWDWTLFATGALTALLFGVAFGNLFLGVSFSFDADLRSHPDITLGGLLSPFALFVGLVSVAMLALHGATWLWMKTEGHVASRAARLVPWLALAFAVLFLLAGLWLMRIDGFRISSLLDPGAASNPLFKTVARVKGGWFANFDAHGWYWAIPLAAFVAAGVAGLTRRAGLAFIASSVVCATTVATGGVALFPFLLPSASAPDASLTVWDASSTATTLTTMLIVTAVLLPVILLYTAFIHRKLRGKVGPAQVDEHGSY